MRQPLISIVMPVYNAGVFLDSSIPSALEQSYSNLELVIVDDGSTDNSWERIRAYSERDQRIVFFQLPHIGSPKKVRDYAISHSSGEWIVALDADDVIEEQYLEKLWKRHLETMADFVCPLTYFVEGNDVKSMLPNNDFDFSTIYNGTEAMLRTLNGWEFGTGGALLNRKIITNLSTEKDGAFYNDECDSRIYLNNSNLVAFCDAKYYYMVNLSSYTRNLSVARISFDLRNALGLYRYFESKYGYSAVLTESYRKKMLDSFQETIPLLAKNGRRLKGTMTKDVKAIIVEAYSLFRYFNSPSLAKLLYFRYKMFLIRHVYYK